MSEMEGMPPCKHCHHAAEDHDDEWGSCGALGLTDTRHEVCECAGYEEDEEAPDGN
jgi:hypothetical protein